MVSNLSQEINEFHKRIRARALLIAVEWAGSADALARMVGLSRSSGQKWTQRGQIPPNVALSLSRIRGFPLAFEDMRPADSIWTLQARRCPHCDREIKARDSGPGCLPILKRRSEAAARKLAGATPGVLRRKRQAKAAERAARS